MGDSMQLNLPPAPLQNLSSTDVRSESSRNRLKEWDDLPARALGRASISQKSAALSMGKSESWLSRALRSLEKLGWADLGAIEDPLFWGELMQLVAEYHGLSYSSNEEARKDQEIGRRLREVAGLLR